MTQQVRCGIDIPKVLKKMINGLKRFLTSCPKGFMGFGIYKSIELLLSHIANLFLKLNDRLGQYLTWMIGYPKIKVYAAIHKRWVLHTKFSEYIKSFDSLPPFRACQKYPFFPAFAGVLSVR